MALQLSKEVLSMMYVPFIIYVLVISIVLSLIFSKKFRKWFLIIVVSVVLIAATLSLHGIARAQVEEIKTCWIVEFDLAESIFIVEDEDGFLWEFKLDKDNYSIGDEYVLHLFEYEEPWLEEV
jgi:hypothetical protein